MTDVYLQPEKFVVEVSATSTTLVLVGVRVLVGERQVNRAPRSVHPIIILWGHKAAFQ